MPIDAAAIGAVADFVIGLTIAQRGLLIYGADHEVGQRGIERAAAALARALELRAPIALRFSPQTIYVDGHSLGRRHPVFRGFAEKLWRRGLAGLTFHLGAGAESLLALLQPLAEATRQRASRERTERMLREARPPSIELVFLRQLVDHEVRDEVESLSPTEAKRQWEELIAQLAALGNPGGSPLAGGAPAALLPAAEVAPDRGERPLDYAGAVVDYLKRWQQSAHEEHVLRGTGFGRRVGELVGGINPELRRQIVTAAVVAPDVTPETLQSFVHVAGHEALLESLRHLNERGQSISPTAFRALSMLAVSGSGVQAPQGATVTGAPAAGADLFGDELQELLDAMMADDAGEAYTPEELAHILREAERSAERLALVPRGSGSPLALEEAEQHFLHVARELHRADPADRELATTVCRESQRAYLRLLESGSARGWESAMEMAREAGTAGGHPPGVPWAWEDEQVLERLRERLLEGGRWAAEASVDQLVAIGGAAVPLLVEVLATSDSMSVRRRALKGLEEMPDSPSQHLLPLLDPHQPWYLQRNAVYVLRHRRDAAGAEPVKALWRRADPRVRLEVVPYLLAIEDADRLRYLAEALADADNDHALAVARAALKRPTREVIVAVMRRAEQVAADLVGAPFHLGLLRALAATRQPQALHYVAEVPARRLPVLPWQRERFRREVESMVRHS